MPYIYTALYDLNVGSFLSQPSSLCDSLLLPQRLLHLSTQYPRHKGCGWLGSEVPGPETQVMKPELKQELQDSDNPSSVTLVSTSCSRAPQGTCLQFSVWTPSHQTGGGDILLSVPFESWGTCNSPSFLKVLLWAAVALSAYTSFAAYTGSDSYCVILGGKRHVDRHEECWFCCSCKVSLARCHTQFVTGGYSPLTILSQHLVQVWLSQVTFTSLHH